MTSAIHNNSTNLNPSDYNYTDHEHVVPAKLDFAQEAISGQDCAGSSEPLTSEKVTKNGCFTAFIKKIIDLFKKIFPCFFKKDDSLANTELSANNDELHIPIFDMSNAENVSTPPKPVKKLADEATRAAAADSPFKQFSKRFAGLLASGSQKDDTKEDTTAENVESVSDDTSYKSEKTPIEKPATENRQAANESEEMPYIDPTYF